MGFNKKVLSKAVSELGKAKAPAKPRDIITDPAGQWKFPGQKTRIPGSSITMQGVNYPVWAQPNVGPGSMMQPNQDYEFPNADYVDETPIAKKGGSLKSKKYSSNISATNKLFTKNKLFQKKKHKIFDPNAKFQDGGQSDGLYTHSGHNYKKIDGKWYMEPVKNSGEYKLIEQGDVKSRIAELEKNAKLPKNTKDYFSDKQIATWGYKNNNRDSNEENVFEIFDPTGLSSWDDVYRSAQKTGWGSGKTAIEMFGAIPMLGKAKLLGKAVDAEKAFARTARQKNNVKAVANTLKAVGTFGPAAGRGVDAIQAYREFKSGGSKLGPINLNPNPLSHYELNYGFNLPTKQKGGLHSNPWLYTYNQEDEEGNPAQVIGLGANFQHKSGLHGEANVELPFFNKDAIRNSNTELGYTKRYKNLVADATLQNSANPYKQFDPSLNIGVGYNKNLGKHVGFGIEASNKMMPGKPWNPGIHAGMTYNFQDGGENDDEYMDLTDEEIQAYRDGGYVVEELPEAQEGGPTDTIIYPPGDSQYMNQPALNYDILEMQNQKARRNYEQYLKNTTDPTNLQRTSPAFQQKHFMNEGIVKAEIGGYVQHELVKAQNGLTKKPLKISDPDEYAFRKAAYDDSSTMHRLYDNDYNAVKKFKTINEINNYRNSQIKSKGKQENAASIRLGNPNPEKVETHTNLDGEYTTTTYKKPVQPVQFVPNIKSTSKKGVWSGGSEEQFPTGINTSDFERKTREYQEKQRTNRPIAKAQKGRTVIHTDRDLYDKAFAAESDSSDLYNNAKKDFNKFNKIGDLFNTNLSPEKWQKANKEYDRLLNSQEKKWHTFPYKNGDVSKYIPGYTENYKYKGPRSGLIIKPVGLEKFYREGYDFPKFKKPVIHNIYEGPSNESISTLPLKPIQQFIIPEQNIIPGRPYTRPKQYAGPRYGTLAGDENLDLPDSATQQEIEAARRERDRNEWQRKTLKYQQQRMSKPIAKAQTGLTKKPLIISDPKEFAYRNKMYADSLSLYNNSEKLKKPYYKKLADVKKDKSNLFMGVSTAYQTKANNYKVNQYNKNGKIDQTSTGPGHFSTDYIGGSETDPDDWTKEVKKNHKTIRPVSANSFSYADKDFHLYNPYLLNYKKPVQQVQFQKDEAIQPKNTQEIYTVERLPFLPTTTIQSLNPELIPAKPHVKAVKPSANKGVWSDGSDGQYPQGLNDWERKTREYQQQQRGNKTVAQVRKEGGALDSYQKKGEVKTFKRDIRDQDALSNTGWSSAPVQKKKVVTTKKVPTTLKEKLNQTPQQAFDNDFKVVTAKENAELKEKTREQNNAFKNQQMPGYKDYGPQSAGSADWFWTLPIAGPAALEAAGSLGAMQLPGMASVPGATLGNAANAGFIAHGITQTPKTIKAWNDVAKGKKKWQDAALETGMNLSEFIGSGAGIKSLAQDINQGGKYLGKTLGTETGILSNKNLLKGYKEVPKELPGSSSSTKGTDYIWKNVDKNIVGELPEGITKQQIADVLESKVSWIESPEYAKRRMATTGETLEEVAKDVQKLKARYENTKIHFKPIKEKEKAVGFYQSTPFQSSKDIIVVDPARSTSLEDMLGTLDHEIDHALSPAQKNNKLYNNYPFMPTDMGDAHRAALKKWPQSTFSKFIKGDKSKVIPYLEQAPEQQVRFNRLNQKIREDLNLTRNEGELTKAQFDEWVNEQKNNNFEGLDEGHRDVVDLLLNKSKSMDRPAILKILNKAWSIAPIAGATGAIGTGALKQEKTGGVTEAWEDELSDDEIEELRKAGYTVEELD